MDQTPFAEFNQNAMVVSNLDTSEAFFQRLFQFDTIFNPIPPRKGIHAKWLKTREHTELHLAELEGDTSIRFNPDHLSIKVASIDTVLERLLEVSNAHRSGKGKRPDTDTKPYGARTILINDPDGYGIHIIESTSEPDR